MKQSPDYHYNLARLAVIQQLRSYGIKIKHWNSKQRTENGKGTAALHTGKIFGSPIHMLPQLYIRDYGNIPVFLAEVCKYLENHVHTEGLFRKSGSVVRQKLLKAKLDRGENDLSDSPPCDVAGILKQFFRELPDPILPVDLQDALCKAQQLASDEEKASATMLISCLMPERTVSVLRYFFNFLQTVSVKSDVNKMDSSNLAVIFAPNLLQSDDNDKISGSTEKKLRTQAAIVKMLIDQASEIGCVPDFLLEKIPGMLGVDVSGTPGTEMAEEGEDSPGERKRRRRRSVGDFVSGALNRLKTNRTPTSTPLPDRTVLSSMVTPLILTPSTKRKLPLDSMHGISNKKRKSIKHNLTFELLPSSLFGGSTPSSAQTEGSPCVFETSENAFSPSVSSKHLSSSGNLRRSKRYENKRVQRVESGKTGCFSPKISRKEMVRRSLRIRFSLGKSNKDVSSSSMRSQNIGWRLANSQELAVVGNKVDSVSSPAESPFVSAGSKKISKSEDNLLTPQKSDDSNHRMSWTGPHQLRDACDGGSPLSGYLYAGNCYSEPFLVTQKPPTMPQEAKSLGASNGREIQKEHSLSEDGECQVQDTVRKITKAFTESGSDLNALAGCSKSLGFESPECNSQPQIGSETLVAGLEFSFNGGNETCRTEPQTVCKINTSENYTGGDQICMLELQKTCKNKSNNGDDYTEVTSNERLCKDVKVKVDEREVCTVEEPAKRVDSSSHERLGQIILKIVEDSDSIKLEDIQVKRESGHKSSSFAVNKSDCSDAGKALHMLTSEDDPLEKCRSLSASSKDGPSAGSHSAPVRRSTRVSDHIQHFNRLCLSDRSVAHKVKSPIKLQRTPVRQSIRRINSLLEVKRGDHTRIMDEMSGSPMVKSVSCDGSLSSDLPLTRSSPRLLSANSQENSASCDQLPVYERKKCRLPKQSCANASASVNPIKSALEDLTNRDLSRPVCPKSEHLAQGPNSALRVISAREQKHYRGSPKNPIARVSFLPASRPLDL